MKGIVSCIKHSGRNNTYYAVGISSGTTCLTEAKSDLLLKLGESIEVKEGGEASDLSNDVHAEDLHRSIIEHIDKSIEKTIQGSPYKEGREEIDRATARAWDKILSASRLLLRKLLLGTPIVIRFHNDADGSTGAYALYKAINTLSDEVKRVQNIIWVMNRGITYGKEEALSDILKLNNYDSIERPLIVLIDFGTSESSNYGTKEIKDSYDIIWLDHHPPVKAFEGRALEHYINPWLFGSDSNYTAGFLTCAFVHSFSSINTEDLEHASFIGDYSKYAGKDPDSIELSALLDLVTSDISVATSRENLTPSEIGKVLSDNTKRKELLNYASVRLTETVESALRSLKSKDIGPVNIHISDFEDFKEKGSKYPLPGRLSSKVLDKISELSNKESILILHSGSYISVRIDKKIVERVNILGIIEDLKSRYKQEIENGGGHMAAASLKLFRKEDKKEILKALVNEIRLRFSKAS